jgi:hypothetical protein
VRGIQVPSYDRSGLDEFKTPHRFQMNSPHEACADNRSSDYFHGVFIGAC